MKEEISSLNAELGTASAATVQEPEPQPPLDEGQLELQPEALTELPSVPQLESQPAPQIELQTELTDNSELPSSPRALSGDPAAFMSSNVNTTGSPIKSFGDDVQDNSKPFTNNSEEPPHGNE